MKTEEAVKAFAFTLGGFALGAACGTACGLLFAPKKGSELREDIGEWTKANRQRSREMYARVKEYIPHKDKSVASQPAVAG